MSSETCDKCHFQCIPSGRMWDTKRLVNGDGRAVRYERVCATCYIFLRDNRGELFETETGSDEGKIEAKPESETGSKTAATGRANSATTVLSVKMKRCRWCGKEKKAGLCPHCGKDGRTWSKRTVAAESPCQGHDSPQTEPGLVTVMREEFVADVEKCERECMRLSADMAAAVRALKNAQVKVEVIDEVIERIKSECVARAFELG